MEESLSQIVTKKMEDLFDEVVYLWKGRKSRS